MLGMNTNAKAQQTPVTILYEQTIQGSLDATDPAFEDGAHYDEYIFQGEAGKSYMITAQSNTFAAWVDLFGFEEIIQGGFVGVPGAQVQFSGILEQPGQYWIFVSSIDAGVLGSYTLTLSEHTGSTNPGAVTCCKRCSEGKPCGDSCISLNYQCHQPPGCACY
jgi:hypothetical protein